VCVHQAAQTPILELHWSTPWEAKWQWREKREEFFSNEAWLFLKVAQSNVKKDEQQESSKHKKDTCDKEKLHRNDLPEQITY
jgi:hypothetical protein